MKSASLVIALAVTAWCGAAQQRSAATSLAVRVEPEQHLTPARVDLVFHVSADGSADLVARTQLVTAWVRALPGQAIRVTARASGLPAEAELRWTSAVSAATGGAQNAAGTSGLFQPGDNDLVANWTRSGILTWALTLELSNPRALAAGDYPVSVTLAIQ